MFGWLKRTARSPARQASAKKRPEVPRTPADPAAALPSSMPLPEVVGEGNTQADWSAWEDSMTALDSQMQALGPSQEVRVRDTVPDPLPDDVDPFSSVRRKRGA